jgi:hypothetical protein
MIDARSKATLGSGAEPAVENPIVGMFAGMGVLPLGGGLLYRQTRSVG